MAKLTQKHPYLWRSPQKSLNPKRNIFFSILTPGLAESVEGLNSSLALAAGDLWPKKGGPTYWRARSLKGWTVTVNSGGVSLFTCRNLNGLTLLVQLKVTCLLRLIKHVIWIMYMSVIFWVEFLLRNIKVWIFSTQVYNLADIHVSRQQQSTKIIPRFLKSDSRSYHLGEEVIALSYWGVSESATKGWGWVKILQKHVDDSCGRSVGAHRFFVDYLCC